MNEPLTESQQVLRGQQISDMAIYQLHDWIAACKKMVLWARTGEDRTAWKESGQKAMAELERRVAP